ncbi:hypothetical protein C8Z91_10580 [Paenibacillus elgii]|uniref:Lipoprotein n=1 Tax=Paenibacillus elgii TaxID=189691 RepID=A0A2T6G4Z5_9BACL|nr:hypothetical protein [Paenibacillus elgii]PUA39213.1 hypothetical protein C8Z91_10580 [Paenibacillus elgii]
MTKKVVNLLLLTLVCLIVFLFAGCEKTIQKSTSEDTTLEKRKVAISEKIKRTNSSLDIMTSVLQNEWSSLFVQKNEEELFKKYSTITWHVTSQDKEKLKNNLSKHQDYLSYVELYQNKTLPALEAKVKEMKVSEVLSQETNESGYEINVVYRLKLNDNKEKDITLKTQIFSNLEYFSPLFNIDGSQSVSLPLANTEKEELQRKYFYNLASWKTRELTHEELLELLKF